MREKTNLSSTFQGVDDVEGGDRLALGVLSVGDGVTDNVCFKKSSSQLSLPFLIATGVNTQKVERRN